MSAAPSNLRRIAILGCGTVGREVAARLIESGERLGVQVVKILVRDTTRDRGLPTHLFTTSIEDIHASNPDLVVELIGGVEPTRALVASFLARGVPVVTANKTLIAHRGQELAALARQHHTDLAFEASVCAAIPILASLRHLAGDRVLSIRGIVNGSCNFILSRLAEGWRLDDAISEARKRGLVEPDPSADTSGRDSAEKLCVLAAAVGIALSPDRIETKGIESLTPEDLTAARRSGRTIKLLAELDLSDPIPRARVGPTLLPRSHPLAQAEEEENAVAIQTALAGELFLRGRGAGPKPTASAVLGDIARLLSARSVPPIATVPPIAAPSDRCPASPPTHPHSAAGIRPHHIRIHAEGLTPGRILDTLRDSHLEAAELTLSHSTAHILTEPTDPASASACARSLSPGSDPLVMPVL